MASADVSTNMNGLVCIRYYSSVTPKDEGSLIYWRDAPSSFDGLRLLQVLEEKGLPLTDHLPQMYDNVAKGYSNLDSDLRVEVPKDGSMLELDLRLTPLVGPQGLQKETEQENKLSAGTVVLANPGPMALFAFGFTTMLLMIQDTKIAQEGVANGPETGINLVIGYAMFHGGLVQLVVGFIEIRRNNLFGATAFTSYGAFWMGWALYSILQAAGILSTANPHPKETSAFLAIWGIFTTIMFVQTLFINRCLQAIFGLLALVFYLLSAGVFYPDVKVAAGWFGILLVLVVFYTAAAELYNDMGNIRLPLFHVNSHKEEFGNAHAGRGEVLNNADPAGVVPLRQRNFSKDVTALETSELKSMV